MFRTNIFILFCMTLMIIFSYIDLSEPNYIETDLQLTNGNTVVLWDLVDDSSINNVIEEIKLKNAKIVYLILNTNGGSVEAAHNLKQFSIDNDIQIHTVSLNSISSGYILVETLGTRYVTKDSYLMMHEVKQFVQGWANYTDLKNYNKRVFKEADDIYKPLYTRIKMKDWEFRQLITPQVDINYKQALKQNHADSLVKIHCSSDMVDYIKTYKINYAVYEIKFPGCPIIKQPIYVSYVEGIVSEEDKGIIQARFYAGRY